MRAIMLVDKRHTEFCAVDMDSEGWHSPPGYPPEIEQKILAGGLDEANKTGNRTRLLRFKPGAYTTTPFVHDYWEEVYVISGDLEVTDAKNPKSSEKFGPNTYACRPPGISHGPFRSENGCVLIEFHYYETSRRQ
jgi:mannose-6-phosphate isomerase-like protein (cupin superfamily)